MLQGPPVAVVRQGIVGEGGELITSETIDDIDNELTSQLFNPCGCPRPWPGPVGGERTFFSRNLDSRF